MQSIRNNIKVSKGYLVLRKRKKAVRLQKWQELREWRAEVCSRAGGVCEKCGSVHLADPHHFYGRRYRSIWTDPENGVYLCGQHHIAWAHGHPAEFKAWIISRRGQEWYDRLTAKKNRGQGIG